MVRVEYSVPEGLHREIIFTHDLWLPGDFRPQNQDGEVARFYVELRRMGLDITHVDVGGGLGVDYDGTQSTNIASVNYTMQEYANDIVYYIADVCNTEGVPHPDIVSESGRALVAHHSVLFGPRYRELLADIFQRGVLADDFSLHERGIAKLAEGVAAAEVPGQ